MKNLLLTLCFSGVSVIMFGQDTFEIKELGTKYSREFIESSFESADFCGFFYAEERRVLRFDDGTIVEMKSASENTAITSDCVKTRTKSDDSSEWRIANSGHILRILPTQNKR